MNDHFGEQRRRAGVSAVASIVVARAAGSVSGRQVAVWCGAWVSVRVAVENDGQVGTRRRQCRVASRPRGRSEFFFFFDARGRSELLMGSDSGLGMADGEPPSLVPKHLSVADLQ
jgi:hypothetical protein